MAVLVIRRFDVFAPPARVRVMPPLLVVLSSNHVLDIDVVIAAPLVSAEDVKPDPQLNPAVAFEDRTYTLIVSLLGSIPHRRIGRWRGNVLEQSEAIVRALDRLFTGF